MLKRILIVGAIGVGCAGTLYGFFVLYLFIIEPLTTGFQAYTPTLLPTGVHTVSHATQQLLYYGEKHVDISTNIPAFYINENKISASERTDVYSCGLNISPTTCAIYTSPRDQRYQVLVSQDGTGKPSLDTISWVKNQTMIMISIEAPASIQYADTDWGRVVDSFTAVNYGYERGSVVRNQGV